MKQKFNLSIDAIRIPNSDKYAIVKKYTQDGATFTDNNEGRGYSLEEVNTKKSDLLKEAR